MVEVKNKNIEWISYLDKVYLEECKNRNNPNFYYYPIVDLPLETQDLKLLYRKQKKMTRIIFGDSYGRRAYFSDADIIKIIVASKQSVYEQFCSLLFEFITTLKYSESCFSINSQDFWYRSIVPQEHDPQRIEVLKNETFETKEDLCIKYIDLITLINLIISKELLADIIRENDRILRQAKKFFVLSKFYRESVYSSQLGTLKYPINKTIDQVYYNSSVGRTIDVIFGDLSL